MMTAQESIFEGEKNLEAEMKKKIASAKISTFTAVARFFALAVCQIENL